MHLRRWLRRWLAGFVAAVVGAGCALAVQAPASAAVLGPFKITVPGYNLCLDVKDVSQADGAWIQLWTCLPGQWNQQWYLYEQPGTSGTYRYQIVAAHSGKCLDVKDVNIYPGAYLQQWTCLGWSQNNQIFNEFDAGSGNSYLVPNHSYLCVATTDSLYNGKRVQQQPCYVGYSDVWKII